jgi:hypothetical protein
MDQLSDFLNYARDRVVNDDDETLPCSPEDFSATLGFLCALVSEYELDRQTTSKDDAARLADRKRVDAGRLSPGARR